MNFSAEKKILSGSQTKKTCNYFFNKINIWSAISIFLGTSWLIHRLKSCETPGKALDKSYLKTWDVYSYQFFWDLRV